MAGPFGGGREKPRRRDFRRGSSAKYHMPGVVVDRPPTLEEAGYFNELLSVVKLVFNVEPRPLTAAIIASAIPAAIRPYSIAVAPD
jgi:hypothetical protein